MSDPRARAAARPRAGAGAERADGDALGTLFREHQRFLWGLCYRLTGSAADADDLVQATFVRALERPPARTDEPWRPWLTRVAVNLGRDLLRRRKRRGYVGPWLPSPIETGEQPLASFEPEIASGVTTEGRYDMLESVSIAFLVALEALTPKQRAVLLLATSSTTRSPRRRRRSGCRSPTSRRRTTARAARWKATTAGAAVPRARCRRRRAAPSRVS
ncbi:MAG: sigma-70 family RNA polymerase sigma factor [Thermodesulfobacteriota bacterium]